MATKFNCPLVWDIYDGDRFKSYRPFYITLHQYTWPLLKTELNIWSGLVFSSTFIVLAIVSPLWGRLADQKGRKLMLLRASLGMAISISLMAFVTAAWQLLILRMLLGAFSGFVSNSMALMASSAPKEKSGAVLSLLTTGSVAGTLIGPIIGGILVNITGYRRVF